MSATATATSVQELDKQLNDDVLSGKIMDAFEKYYAEDVVMQENSEEPRRARRRIARRKKSSWRPWRRSMGAKVIASAVNGDVTLLRMGDGRHVQGWQAREHESGRGASLEERENRERAVFLQQRLKALKQRGDCDGAGQWLARFALLRSGGVLFTLVPEQRATRLGMSPSTLRGCSRSPY